MKIVVDMYGKSKMSVMQIVSYYTSYNRSKLKLLDTTQEIDSEADGTENDIEYDEQTDVLRSSSSRRNFVKQLVI